MKPLSVLNWEARVDALRKELPRNCHTCEHALEETVDEIFCRMYNAPPPANFASEDGACSTWASVLDSIPF